MKKLILLFIILGSFSCKKKDEEKEEEPVTPVAPATVTGREMTAKVNGVPWIVRGNKTSNADFTVSVYSGSNPRRYGFTGYANEGQSKLKIYGGFTYTTGVVDFASSSDFWATYVDSTGTGYFDKAGSFNITLIDTSHNKSNGLDRLQMTFSFVTVSLIADSYTVTDGYIDYEAK